MGEERVTQRTVTVVMATIALLAFVFSFGNVWSLALRLGVPRPIAPLIAPMVDLSVVGLLVGLRYLSLRGVDAKELKGATRLMHLSGLLTLALNIAEPIAVGHYGRAALDAVAPLLLLGWGAVGPQLLRHFHTLASGDNTPALVTEPASDPAPANTSNLVPAPELAPTPPELLPTHDALAESPASAISPDTPALAPDPAPTMPVPPALVDAARSIADQHHAAHGQAITPAQLRTRLGVSLPLATAAHARL
ncbi:DUF2637 domain-containing protein [Streptomyces triticagri]|uniref:DUF2637 domain-containing protein n=1 Tax=Streptomyces triticagri TaxID=2293568 RepID=A0A372LW32_9ACTN|nr:DUF2637 domain-containing protein [Streptomyces triticagri]RFU82886.1 DUF2637 domain-containing protein [Streptomyces triticagri]